MALTMAVISFIAAVAILGVLVFAFAPGEAGVAARVSQMLNTVVAEEPDVSLAERQRERLRAGLASIGKLVSPTAPSSRSQLMLLRAGIRRSDAMMTITGFRILLPILLVAAVLATGVYRWSPFLILLGAAVAGYLIPEAWLLWKISSRQHRLRIAMPDGLDLLVICVEAGLGLDQALLRVAQELALVHPDLSDEIQILNAEMRLGKTRTDALRELARRTGLEDIKALVSMLIQTERFGTSIAQSLRVFSDDLRTKRRQRAEEAAAKISVKMVPVLVIFILPALLVVVAGPAIIGIIRQFFNLKL